MVGVGEVVFEFILVEGMVFGLHFQEIGLWLVVLIEWYKIV